MGLLDWHLCIPLTCYMGMLYAPFHLDSTWVGRFFFCFLKNRPAPQTIQLLVGSSKTKTIQRTWHSPKWRAGKFARINRKVPTTLGAGSQFIFSWCLHCSSGTTTPDTSVDHKTTWHQQKWWVTTDWSSLYGKFLFTSMITRSTPILGNHHIESCKRVIWVNYGVY